MRRLSTIARLVKVLVETGVQPLGFDPGVGRIHDASRRAYSRNLFLGEEGDGRRSEPKGKERIHRCHGEADENAEWLAETATAARAPTSRPVRTSEAQAPANDGG